jgi:formate hydrogenlyase subunit 6/NADH:ubiquinone oxidoreductase subunit I
MCVEACPEDAIRMMKETPDLPGFDRSRMWLRQDELMNWQPRQDVAKPYAVAGASRPEGKP